MDSPRFLPISFPYVCLLNPFLFLFLVLSFLVDMCECARKGLSLTSSSPFLLSSLNLSSSLFHLPGLIFASSLLLLSSLLPFFQTLWLKQAFFSHQSGASTVESRIGKEGERGRGGPVKTYAQCPRLSPSLLFRPFLYLAGRRGRGHTKLPLSFLLPFSSPFSAIHPRSDDFLPPLFSLSSILGDGHLSLSALSLLPCMPERSVLFSSSWL